MKKLSNWEPKEPDPKVVALFRSKKFVPIDGGKEIPPALIYEGDKK